MYDMYFLHMTHQLETASKRVPGSCNDANAIMLLLSDLNGALGMLLRHVDENIIPGSLTQFEQEKLAKVAAYLSKEREG